jgi:Cu+-exporting ATPase
MKDIVNLRKIDLNIQGMTCANCSNRIEKTLNKTMGILGAKVDLASESATIQFDQEKISEEFIINRIKQLGYQPYPANLFNKFIDVKQKEMIIQKRKFLLSIVLTIPIMLFNMYWIYKPETFLSFVIIFCILLFLTSIVLFYCGNQFFIGFYKSLKNLYPDMNTLVAIGTLSAFIFSIYGFYNYLKNPSNYLPHFYFDTTATIITFILLGKYLERKSINSTSDALKKLLLIQNHDVTIIRNNQEYIISSEFILPNDIVLLRPGDSIPIDGKIIEGQAFVDESFITGESLPIDVNTGDNVISGSIVKSGYLKVLAEKVGKDSYLSKVIELIKNAQSSKPPVQKLTDKIASFFVPTIIIISLIAFLYWYNHSGLISEALLRAISVLIISCPCALGLATPTAIVSAIGLAAKNNIFFKNIDTLERIKKINAIVFDKTGTITEGILRINEIESFSNFLKEELLKIAASGEYFSEHPIGKTIVESYKKDNTEFLKIENFVSLSGYGIKFKLNKNDVEIGNLDLMKDKLNYNDLAKKFEEDLNSGDLNIYTSINNSIVGRISLNDYIKKDAKPVIQKIKKLKIQTYLISGDNEIRTQKTAKNVEVDQFYANVKPDEKLDIIKNLQSQGLVVAMVGDGTNDAPALAKADISIAYSSGTDVAIDTSSITITKNDLNSVYNSIIISNKTMMIIKQNLFWAFIYNIICIPIAAGVINNLKLDPSLAALAMAFSSISVVSNSLRIKLMKLYGK